MKRIAIITPCILPVPATRGGAVEGLITKLINDNEKYKNFIIDLFAINDSEYSNYNFVYTNIITVQTKKTIKLIDRILDKIFRTLDVNASFRYFDRLISRCFLDRLIENDGKYDAVIIENMMSMACEIVHICQKTYGVPVYFHMHNDVDMYRSPRHIQELVRCGVQFLSVSDYIKRHILECDSNAIVSTLYNGVNFHSFSKAASGKRDNLIILYAGRIIPNKGVKELAQAFINSMVRIEESYRNRVILEIVGFSGLNRTYEDQIRKIIGENKNIHCIDQRSPNEMPEIYQNADILVVPTIDEEPFGLVALEGMACGLPVIVTDSGALPEIVGDGAHVIDKENNLINNLSVAIEKLVEDEEFRKELSDKANRRVHSIESFDIDNYYLNFVKIIDDQIISDEDKISVIIPVYNVNSYLKTSIESVIAQSYKNLEIIIIDDGSTDGSGEICDEYAGCDDRIRVIHQENAGLSAARNVGINNSTGKYLFFCDSDDYVLENALEKLIIKLKKDHSDIVACGFANFQRDGLSGKESAKTFTDEHFGLWSGHESVIQMMRSDSLCSVAWNKLYKREVFDGIRFPSGIINEDEATIYRVLYRAKLVSYLPDVLYMYRQRESSITHIEMQDRYRFLIKAGIDRIDFFKDNGDDELEQHSRITLLEWIKFSYRKIDNVDIKKELLGIYKGSLILDNAPIVMGRKKQLALILWKYLHY